MLTSLQFFRTGRAVDKTAAQTLGESSIEDLRGFSPEYKSTTPWPPYRREFLKWESIRERTVGTKNYALMDPTAGLWRALTWADPSALPSKRVQSRSFAMRDYKNLVRFSPLGLCPDRAWISQDPGFDTKPNARYPWAVPSPLISSPGPGAFPQQDLLLEPQLDYMAAGWFHGGHFPMLSRKPADLFNELWALWAVYLPILLRGRPGAPWWTDNPAGFEVIAEAIIDPQTLGPTKLFSTRCIFGQLFSPVLLILLQSMAIRRLAAAFPWIPHWQQMAAEAPRLPAWALKKALHFTAPELSRCRVLLPLTVKYWHCPRMLEEWPLFADPFHIGARPWLWVTEVTPTVLWEVGKFRLRDNAVTGPLPWLLLWQAARACDEGKPHPYWASQADHKAPKARRPSAPLSPLARAPEGDTNEFRRIASAVQEQRTGHYRER